MIIIKLVVFVIKYVYFKSFMYYNSNIKISIYLFCPLLNFVVDIFIHVLIQPCLLYADDLKDNYCLHNFV